MLRLLAAASTLALASPALAQDNMSADDPASTTSATTPGTDKLQETEVPASGQTPQAPQSAPSDTPTDTAMDKPATGAQTTEPATGNKAENVQRVVEAEFGSYDLDKSGDLSESEFNIWVGKLYQQSLSAQGKSAAQEGPQTETWLKNAFAKADVDKNTMISKTELQTFLMG